MIFASFHSEKVSTYWRSRATRLTESTVERPFTCQSPVIAGPEQPVQVLVVVGPECELIEQEGADADHAHIAPEHVEELGEFVEAGLAEESTDFGDAWIVFAFELEVVGDVRRREVLRWRRAGHAHHRTSNGT